MELHTLTSGTRRVNLGTNPVISHEWGKDREVFTTSGTYPWSFVTQILHNGQAANTTIYHTWGMHVNHFITVVVFESRMSYNSIDLYQNEKLSRIIYLYYFFYCTCLNIDVKFLNNNNMCDTTWIIQLNNQLLQQIV